MTQFRFNLAEAGLVADLQRYGNLFTPSLVYSQQYNQSFYFPLAINSWSGLNVSKLLKANAFEQAKLLQEYIMSPQSHKLDPISNMTSLLTIVDPDNVPKKMQNALKDFLESNKSLQQYMGYIGTELLGRGKFDTLVHQLLGIPLDSLLTIHLNDWFGKPGMSDDDESKFIYEEAVKSEGTDQSQQNS